MKRLREIYEYRDMIYEMSKRELRGRYQKSVLGVMWNFLNPLFQILVYTIVFGYIFPNNMEAYPIFLTAGLIPWNFFSESLSVGTAAIATNADMVKKIYFPREVLVISSVLAKFINLLISFIIIFLFIAISGRGVNPAALPFLIPVLLVEFLLTLGLTLLLSAIDVYLRDMEYIINILMMAWIWATPIMYNFSTVTTPALRRIIRLNPMTSLTLAYQDILYWKAVPDLSDVGIVALVSLAILVIGELLFQHLEGDFAEEL